MPELLAGHSLGEYAALVAAESIDFEDSVYLVSKRAELMTNESTKQGAMAAIIGLPDDKVIEICKVASLELGQIVDAANFNSPQQVVISGEKEAVDKVTDIAKQNGAKKVAILPVSIA
jgi:[acyl-carrier-protein] S-malonyltransferase